MKDDTIYRQAAIQHLKKRLYETALNSITEHPYYEEMADNRVDVWLNELPSAEQQGKWVKWGSRYKCNQCNLTNEYKKPYCPNCGAKMMNEVSEDVDM